MSNPLSVARLGGMCLGGSLGGPYALSPRWSLHATGLVSRLPPLRRKEMREALPLDLAAASPTGGSGAGAQGCGGYRCRFRHWLGKGSDLPCPAGVWSWAWPFREKGEERKQQ